MSDTSNKLAVVPAHVPPKCLARPPALSEKAFQFGPSAFCDCCSASLAVRHKHGPAQEHLHPRTRHLDQEGHARTGWQKFCRSSRAEAASDRPGVSMLAFIPFLQQIPRIKHCIWQHVLLGQNMRQHLHASLSRTLATVACIYCLTFATCNCHTPHQLHCSSCRSLVAQGHTKTATSNTGHKIPSLLKNRA